VREDETQSLGTSRPRVNRGPHPVAACAGGCYHR
jgi:hypothetical protein